MAANQHSDIDLMMFADGELNEDEARALRDAAEHEPEVAARLGGLEELGEGVRTLVETSVDEADQGGRFGDLWARIERGIEQTAATPRSAANVESVPAPGDGEQVARKKPGVETESGPGFWQALREWFSGGTLATGLVAAGAVAVVFVALRPFERVVEKRVEIVREVPATPTNGTPVVPAARLVSQPAEVEDLEVYNGSGMILTIPGDGTDDSPTTVIWLSSDDTIEGPI